jgi:O-phospho-L-seryl-tRNASec:L-selenocysteinyl-tRNA synthase
VELAVRGEELGTDLAAVRAEVERIGPESVLAVFTTTSCFAPRAPDDLPGVAQICKEVCS